MRLRLVVLSMVGTVIGLPAPCLSQPRDADFRSLQAEARSGDLLVVTGIDGVRIKGALEAASDSLIALRTSNGRVEFAVREVREVRRQPDRVTNGTLWGLVIGTGGGLVVGLAIDASRGEGTWLAPQITAAGAGFGVLGGWLGDLLIRHDDVLFRAESSGVGLRVAPVVARRAISIRGAVLF